MLERRLLPSQTPAHQRRGILSVGNYTALCPSLHSQVFSAINYGVFRIKLPGAGLPLKKRVPIRDKCVMNNSLKLSNWEIKCLGGDLSCFTGKCPLTCCGIRHRIFPRSTRGIPSTHFLPATLQCLGITPPPLTEGYRQSTQYTFWFPNEIILLLIYMAKTILES